MSTSINYAQSLGIRSVAAAVIFAIIYLPLVPIFLLKLRGAVTWLLVVLFIFCLIRVTVFVIRAIAAASSAVGQNFGLIIAESILVSIGFLGLLSGAYRLVVERLNLYASPPTSSLSRFTRSERLFDLVALVAVITSTISSYKTAGSNPTESDQESGKTLKEVSTVMFLILTVLQTLQTIILVRSERSIQNSQGQPQSFGSKHTSIILLLLSVMLLVREAFSTATMSDIAKANNEVLWYPLVALPEFICAVLYAIPGVIPDKEEARQRTEERLPMYREVPTPSSQ
ncbi:hypothetical protein L218DRAFT_930319 [Marasmius fiardii PR-910]|nr:hypothetical protein L218DRAFT_930319 [Marasmius fiardii PR-910]